MSERASGNRSGQLRALLQRIADAEGRLLRNTTDLQALVDDLTDRGVITKEGEHFRIRWGTARSPR